jgi:ADP-heptose:LPS heptosyltransferase
MGDVIHGVPVLCALRSALPDAFIGWVIEGQAGDIVEGHPDLDEAIRVPRHWLASPREIWRLRRRLRELRFDTAIDLQCLTKSAVAARLSGAKRRIGKSGPGGRELSPWLHNDFIEPTGVHVVDQYVSMLWAVGIERADVRFHLSERSADARMAGNFLRASRLRQRQYAILNPGAGWPSKIWPAERYGAVAQHLARVHSIPSVAVWGASDELRLAKTIVATSNGHANLAPNTSMTELGALCRRAALFVGSDTGPMHLAVAVGTPTISMHGTSRAEWCGAYGEENIRLQVRYQDGSALERRQADNSAMCAITVEMACNACDRLMASIVSRRCG